MLIVCGSFKVITWLVKGYTLNVIVTLIFNDSVLKTLNL